MLTSVVRDRQPASGNSGVFCCEKRRFSYLRSCPNALRSTASEEKPALLLDQQFRLRGGATILHCKTKGREGIQMAKAWAAVLRRRICATRWRGTWIPSTGSGQTLRPAKDRGLSMTIRKCRYLGKANIWITYIYADLCSRGNDEDSARTICANPSFG